MPEAPQAPSNPLLALAVRFAFPRRRGQGEGVASG
jgi:hypothetical protein